jgi:hypothetical protein
MNKQKKEVKSIYKLIISLLKILKNLTVNNIFGITLFHFLICASILSDKYPQTSSTCHPGESNI